jgi:CMP-N-acetylneuraminic acid synthetase
MEVVGVIPARGGSKGIPNKNLALLAGKPLLTYTCEQALRAKTLTRVIVSTDDPAIAQCAKACGVEVPFLRPPALAADDTPMLAVLCHALDILQQQDGYVPNMVVLLQPTSPLRKAEHIDEAVRLLLDSDAESVVSVVEVPHQYNPVSLLRVESGCLVPYLNGPQVLRRQDKPALYARNGPAVVAVRHQVLLEQKSFYGNVSHPLVMSAESSVDIDQPADLALAECLLRLESMKSTQ